MSQFLTLDNQIKPIKQTRFNYMVNISYEVNEPFPFKVEKTFDTPSGHDYTLYLGKDKFYGDVFKCWNEGEEDNFTLYFGEKGDEFN